MNYPEYFFTLTLKGLRSSDNINYPNRPVCFVTNSSLGCLFNPLLNIQSFPTGNTQAISFGRTLSPNPSYYLDIPLSTISSDIILSRQLIGTDMSLDLSSVSDALGVISHKVLLKGTIGNISQSLTRIRLEYLSDVDRLKSPDRYHINVNCMNTLGNGKCQGAKETTEYKVTNVINQDTFVTNHPGIFQPTSEYEVIIGTSTYLVNKSLSGAGNLKVFGTIQGKPQFLKLQRHCNLSVRQCRLYGQIENFNGNVFLASSQIYAAT